VELSGFEPKRNAKKSFIYKAFSDSSPILHQFIFILKKQLLVKVQDSQNDFLGLFYLLQSITFFDYATYNFYEKPK
jgi:hypothetical protein